MKLEILTPEAKVFYGEAISVICPGIDGYFGVLNNHAPLIAALKQGEVKIKVGKGVSPDEIIENKFTSTTNNDHEEMKLMIKGGMLEVNKNKVIILAE